MSGAVYEYRMVGWFAVFITLAFFTMATLGLGQLQADDVVFDRKPNVFDGLSYYFTNPNTEPWSKALWSVIIIAPSVGVSAMAIFNAARGR